MSKNPVPLKIRTWLVLSIIIGVGVPAAWAGQGWYLLVAPLVKSSANKLFYDFSAPLNQWRQERSFGTAAECESDKATSRRTVAERIQRWAEEGTDKEVIEIERDGLYSIDRSLCVASDDSRLPNAWPGHGWYLLVPALSGRTRELKALLRVWEQIQAYDTGKECENDKQRKYEFVEERLKSNKDRESSERFRDILDLSRCIASDDPRLK